MRSLTALVALSLFTIHQASPQEASLLLGGVHARYGDSLSGDAGLVSLRLNAASPTAAGGVEAAFSQFTTGGWAAQIGGNASAVASLGSSAALGVVGSGTLSTFRGGMWSGQGRAGPLLVLGGRRALATLGASIGGVRNVADSAFGFWSGSASIMARSPSGAAVWGGVNATTSDTTRYADVTAGVSYTSPTVRIGVQGGVRAGDLADDPWGQARLEWFGSGRVGIEAAAGRYPRDLVGFTDGFFFTAGVRIGLAGTLGGAAPETRAPVRTEHRRDGAVRIRVRYAGAAERVEIAGEWNGWTPLLMRRGSGGEWFADVSLEPGLYQYSLVVDGGAWVVPEGAPAVPDEFGGEVGVLVVHPR